MSKEQQHPEGIQFSLTCQRCGEDFWTGVGLRKAKWLEAAGVTTAEIQQALVRGLESEQLVCPGCAGAMYN